MPIKPLPNTLTPKAPRILVFDSGVGGLTIVESILKQHPYCNITYASDNAAFPYGTKTENALIQRVDKVINQIQNKYPADIIVIACNTASTVALPFIRNRIKQPIIGVVPAIKPASLVSKSKVIGLLATPGTIARQYTKDLISEFAHDCKVHTIGSSELVLLAEEYLRETSEHAEATLSEHTQEKLAIILQPFIKKTELDTVVLACTHFPLLASQLKTIMPNVTHWIDSGEAIARRVGFWLNELQFDSANPNPKPEHLSIFTAQDKSIESLQPALSARQLGKIHFLDLEKSNVTASL